MLARHLLLLAAVFLVIADAPARADDTSDQKQPLTWKVAKGDILDIERISLQKQTVKMRGQTFSHDQKTTTSLRLVVRAVRADGFVIDASKTRVETQRTVDGKKHQSVRHDNLMKGITFRLTVSPSGRLVGFEGYEDFLKKLAVNLKDEMPAYGADTILKVLRPLYSEDALKQNFRELFGPLPEKDGVLEHAFVEPISLFGSLHCTANYAPDRAGTIRYTITTKYLPPSEKAEGVLKISRGEVKSQKASGTITFDPRAGRLIEHRRSMKWHGVLYLKSDGKEEPVEFTSDNELSIRMK